MNRMLFLLFIISVVPNINGYLAQFELEIIFADGPNYKALLIDLTSTASYVLDHRYFAQLTQKEQDFDPTKSPTFKETSHNFRRVYFSPYNTENVAVEGIVGKDKFNLLFEDIAGEFAVINKTDNNKIVQGLDGHYYTGRIGFSRAESNVAELRNAIFASHVNHSLCMYVALGLGGRTAVVSVSIGDESYEKSNFITKFDAEPNKQGNWQVPVNDIAIGNYVYKSQLPGILSTTTDKIGVPTAVFNAFLKSIKASFDRELNAYVVQCVNQFHDSLRISVNTKEVEIDFESYTKKVGSKCVVNLIPLRQSIVLLGAPFFNNHGVCLDFIKKTVILFDAPPIDSKISENNRTVISDGRKTEFIRKIYNI